MTTNLLESHLSKFDNIIILQIFLSYYYWLKNFFNDINAIKFIGTWHNVKWNKIIKFLFLLFLFIIITIFEFSLNKFYRVNKMSNTKIQNRFEYRPSIYI